VGHRAQKFAPGTRHTGKVVRLEKFGAFIELEAGMDGLLHVTDLSFERIEHPNEVLKEGQELDVVIHYFDIHSKKIGLHPAPPADRPAEAPQKIVRGGMLKAEVVKGEAAGRRRARARRHRTRLPRLHPRRADRHAARCRPAQGLQAGHRARPQGARRGPAQR
jgi:transcriptional accessory protein Tex/SPT6